MNFMARVDALEGQPAARPPGCICPPEIGGWDADCPVHPEDVFSGEAVDAAIQQILREHTETCIDNATGYAYGLGVDDPNAAQQVAARALADNETACICTAGEPA